nr:lysozyme inhibitor LprI family protein [uncultured Flavobacterium sp.]
MQTFAYLPDYSCVAENLFHLNKIAHNDFKKADAELNKVYKQVMKILNEKEKKLMIKAQKDWLMFRDSHCEFEIEQYDGGSIQQLIHSNCLTERTRDRIEDLKAILKDEAR